MVKECYDLAIFYILLNVYDYECIYMYLYIYVTNGSTSSYSSVFKDICIVTI